MWLWIAVFWGNSLWEDDFLIQNIFVPTYNNTLHSTPITAMLMRIIVCLLLLVFFWIKREKVFMKESRKKIIYKS